MLVSIGVVAAAAVLYLLILVVLLEAGALIGFLLGLQPEQVSGHPLVFLLGACLAMAAVYAAWVRRPNVLYGNLSISRVLEVLERRPWTLGLLGLGSVGYLLYGRLVFLYGRIAGGTDEGMYLYAAREAMAGRLPYRDFPFIQGPLHPYLIGLVLAPFGFDERGARVFAIAITLMSLLMTFAAAAKLGGRLAGLTAFGLLITNLDYMGDLSSGVHPSGPTGALLLALGGLVLAHGHPLWSIVPFALATGTRVLFAPLAICAVLAAALMLRQAWKPLLLGVGLAAVIFAPFIIAAPRAAWFDLIGDQTQRVALIPRLNYLGPYTLSLQLRSIQSAALSQVISYWPTLVAMTIVAGLFTWPDARLQLGRQRLIVLAFCVGGAGTMFLIDLVPYPANARYPVPQLPLAAIVGGVGIAFLLRQRNPLGVRAMVAAVAVCLMFVNPFISTREAAGAANFVETYRQNPPVTALEEVAAFVRSITPPGGLLITLETPVAVEAQRRLWPGLGVTSWGVLDLPDAQAQSLGMTTPNLFLQAIASCQATAVIVSDRYTWELGRLPNRDQVQRELARDYTQVKEFPHVSDWGTVHIYVPHDPALCVSSLG